MARKKVKTYTAAEMEDLLKRLIAKRDELLERASKVLGAMKDSPTFEHACELRDATAPIVTLCIVIDKTLPQCLELVKLTERADSIPWLDECGLDD